MTVPDVAGFLASVTGGQAAHQAPNSRYRDTPTARLTNPDGSTTVYLRRRFRPQPEQLTDTGTVTIRDGHRIDTLAAEVFGDPTLFWRLADANLVMGPAELVAEPGRVLRTAAPEDSPTAGAAGIPGGADA